MMGRLCGGRTPSPRQAGAARWQVPPGSAKKGVERHSPSREAHSMGKEMNLGLWIAVGIGIGAAIGAATDQMA
ncbi:MAG: hypothetical protein V3U60_15980, partial [Gammaproteobacteria bacterium]